MTTQQTERADVLALKLKGLKVENIASQLGITVRAVHSHDKEIKKMMAKGDAEELAKMSPEELEFAKTAVGQLLPYMRKSIETVQKSANTLQSIHVKALDVAERIFGIIDLKLEDDKITVKELKELTTLFADTYAVLYNKNGIQIVNLLANGSDGELSEADRRKKSMKDDLLQIRQDHIDSKAIEAEVYDEEDDNEKPPPAV